MKHLPVHTRLAFLAAITAAAASLPAAALADEIVIPNNAPTTAGSGGYSTLLHAQARSYQLVVGSAELGLLPVGSELTGITWRLPSWIVYPSWPATGNSCSFANYDIYFSTSNNPPGSLSTTYTDNQGPDLTLVRGGAMTFQSGHFPGFALAPQVNDFGLYLAFTTPYVYQGGDLLLTLRHDGSSCSSMYLDTVPSPNAQAIGVGSYTQDTNWYGQGLIAMRLEYQGAAPVRFCLGDASDGVACPCGNVPALGSGEGCTNGGGVGAYLTASGTASVSSDSLTLTVSQAAQNELGIFVQNIAIGTPAPFYNGAICLPADAHLVRHYAPPAILPTNTDATGMGTNQSPMTVGDFLGDTQPGVTIYYQFWGRDTASCGNGANFSSGLEVVWGA